MKTLFFTFSLIFSGFFLSAQTSYLATSSHMENDSIEFDVANIGVVWYFPGSGIGSYFYPAGDSTSPFFASHTWFSARNTAGDTLVAANAFYQNGIDFFPGPLDLSGNTDSLTMHNWNHIWNVKRSELDNFYNSMGQAGFDINDAQWDNIRTWPGYGNTLARGAGGADISADVSLTGKTTDDFAPFVDMNNNGIYDPQNGDYPDIKGHQMTWWMYNDAGGAKTHTNSNSMHIEIAAKAYIYQHHTILDNQSFYEYKIYNRSNTDYTEFIFTNMLDADIGYFNDDYMGSDSTLSIGFAYNGDTVDGLGLPNEYGTDIPIAGLYLPGLTGPLGSTGINSVTYHNNNISNTGNPSSIGDYYNYAKGVTRNGAPFTDNCASVGSGTQTKFVYDLSKDSLECDCNNPKGDRRILISSKPISIPAGQSVGAKQVAIIRNLHLDCNETNPWQTVFDTITSNIVDPPLAIRYTDASDKFNLSPVPTQDILEVRADKIDFEEMNVTLMTVIGQQLPAPILSNANHQMKIDVSSLSSGLYLLEMSDGKQKYIARFLKE